MATSIHAPGYLAYRGSRRLFPTLTLVVLAACILASCSETDTPIKPDPPLPVEEIEARVFLLVNNHRVSKGLATLELADVITREARSHSANMASGTTAFGHGGFDQRMQTIAETIPFGSFAENIASSYGFQDPASQSVNSWLNSPPHALNIEGDYNLTGIGVARNASGTVYFTQILVKSR